jgi:quinol monooxygenase YgiN
MDQSKVGFAVIYRWRLHAGKEDGFREAWDAVTRALMNERGALGSRLHRDDDGIWTAYAQWPARETWERSRELGTLDAEASAAMTEAVEESFPPLLLHPVSDHLLHKGIVDQ